MQDLCPNTFGLHFPHDITGHPRSRFPVFFAAYSLFPRRLSFFPACRPPPAQIILAVYYSLCDIILLFQVYYYRRLARNRAASNVHGSPKLADERSRLLPATDDSSASDARTEHDHQHLHESVVLVNPTDVVVEHGHPKPLVPPALLYPLMLSFVAAVGVGAWLFQRHSNASRGHQPELPKGRIPEGHEVELELWSQLLGYASAVLYIGSRVPQIAHN